MLVLSTPRIKQLMQLLLAGFSTFNDLAEGMGCSRRTVKSYVTRMAKENEIDPSKYVVLARLVFLYYEEKIEMLRTKRKGATIEPVTRTSIKVYSFPQVERVGRRTRDVRRSSYSIYDENV